MHSNAKSGLREAPDATHHNYTVSNGHQQQSQQVEAVSSQQTPKSQSYPLPKQSQRPATQHKPGARQHPQQEIIYNPQSFSIQNSNNSGNNRSLNRPTTQGAFLPAGFNNTGQDPSMQTSLTYASQQAQFQLTTINRKNSDKPPINNNNFMNSSQRQQFSMDKDPRGRRQFITQILKMQNNSTTDMSNNNNPQAFLETASPLKVQTTNKREASNSSIINLKRKKIKELLFGGARTGYQGIEKEELQQEKRSLKMSMNVMKDENTRLKTKLQNMQQELTKKDKDIEQLSVQLQQNIIGNVPVKDNIFESFLVSQLKKQNREMKTEIEAKDQTIEKLRRDIKLTKMAELESELQTYIEECSRMRAMIEQLMYNGAGQPQIQQPQYQQQQQDNNFIIKEQARIEEAFYQKELQLQNSVQARQELAQQLMHEGQAKEKLEKKLAVAELRLKKFNALQAENKRKQQIINDRTAELNKLQAEVETLREKAKDRDAANNKNKELVTKYYAQQSALDYKEKKIQELQKRNEELQDQFRSLGKSPLNTAQSPIKTVALPKKSEHELKPVVLSQKSNNQNADTVVASITGAYTAVQVELLFRGIKGQAMTNNKDNINFKNYYTNNKALIQKELDFVKSLDFKNLIIEQLQPKLETLNKVTQFSNYSDLDKFLEISCGFSDLTHRKYLLFHFIFPSSQSLNSLDLTRLVVTLQPQQPLDTLEPTQVEQVQTVRVHHDTLTESQFVPPQEMLQTPNQVNQDLQQQEEAGYEEDFERDEQQQQLDNQAELNPEAVQEEDDDDENSVQITEEQMLDIAESVFQTISDRLKNLQLTVRAAFSKNYQILDEFDGEYNVVIISAQDFLESLRVIDITQLSELEIACLMRVLSKPELNHGIVLNELNLVLENFGIQTEAAQEKEEMKQEVEQKKQKLTKKKMIKNLIAKNDEVFGTLALLLSKFDFNMEALFASLKERTYSKMVKSKKKELKVELIKLEDFLTILNQQTALDINLEQSLINLLQLDTKYPDILQLKTVRVVLEEVLARVDKEEREQKVIAEFYQKGEVQEEKQGKVEVMNFEQFIQEDEGEEEYYTGEPDVNHSKKQSTLNEITEDAANEDQSSPNLHKKSF